MFNFYYKSHRFLLSLQLTITCLHSFVQLVQPDASSRVFITIVYKKRHVHFPLKALQTPGDSLGQHERMQLCQSISKLGISFVQGPSSFQKLQYARFVSPGKAFALTSVPLLTSCSQFTIRLSSLSHTRCLTNGARNRSQQNPAAGPKCADEYVEWKPITSQESHIPPTLRSIDQKDLTFGKARFNPLEDTPKNFLNRWLEIRDIGERQRFLKLIQQRLLPTSLEGILLHHLCQPIVLSVRKPV